MIGFHSVILTAANVTCLLFFIAQMLREIL
jgi:hypothetical protein